MITCDSDHIYRNPEGEIYLSVTQNLIIAGLVDFSMCRPEDLEFAALRGQHVHQAVHLYWLDDLEVGSLDKAYKGYIEGFIKFIKENGIEVWSSEEIVYGELLRSAGQYDFITANKHNHNPCFYEIKTSSTVSAITRLQVAGYQLFYNADPEHELAKIYRRACLHLRPNGTYKLIQYKDHNDEHIFRGICRANWWSLNNRIIPVGARSNEKVYNLCKEIIG